MSGDYYEDEPRPLRRTIRREGIRDIIGHKTDCPNPVKHCGWPLFLFIAGAIVSLTVIIFLVAFGVVDSPNDMEIAYVQTRFLRTNTSNILGSGTNYTIFNQKFMAVQLVEDLTAAGLDKGDVRLIFTNANCTNNTLASCESSAMTYYDMYQTNSNIRSQMLTLYQNFTIKANHDYWYARIIFCKPGDTQNTTQYKFSQMNITKSWQIDECNVTTLKATTPVNVRNRQGAIVTLTLNVTGLFHESYSDPALTTLQYNLTKVGPFWVSPNNHYYYMDEPVFKLGFTPCKATFDASRALACSVDV